MVSVMKELSNSITVSNADQVAKKNKRIHSTLLSKTLKVTNSRRIISEARNLFAPCTPRTSLSQKRQG